LDETAGLAGLPGVAARDRRSAKTLKLWVRRKQGNKKVICSGCGKSVSGIHAICEREVRDLPIFQFRTTIVIEL
jgi:hypothetical protein